MKARICGLAVATLLVVAPALAAHAEDAAVPTSPQAEPAPRRYRHYAHRSYHRYAYWQPFPVYWPHLYHSRIYWNRIPWFSF